MKTGFIFPGQGSQFVGMMQDLHERFDVARDMLAKAAQILEYDLAEACFNGPDEKLKQTYITQPAIFVHSCILTHLLRQVNKLPDMVAGHSLGEYSALVAAEVLEFEDALALVKVRANAMQAAGEANPGTMAAIIGLEADALTTICEQASDAGVVQPANFNSPGQVVISGSAAGIARAMELATEAGAKRAVQLVVGGAFHSPLMAPAQEELRAAIDATPFRDAKVPVYSNVEAAAVRDANAIRDLLDRQLVSAVRWSESVANMIADGTEAFFEVGPGKVLTGLGRRIDRSVMPKAIGSADEITAHMQAE